MNQESNRRLIKAENIPSLFKFIYLEHQLEGGVARSILKNTIRSELGLIMAGAIILITSIRGRHLNRIYSEYRLNLLQFGFSYSVPQISAMEFEMMKAFDYQLPMWSSLDIARLLSKAMGLSLERNGCIDKVIDIAECNRKTIFEGLKKFSAKTTQETPRLFTLHLAMGAVVATAKYLNKSDISQISTIIKLFQAPEAYIKCISATILKLIHNYY